MRSKMIIALIAMAFVAAMAVPAFATPQKAKQTGKACSSCHQGSKIGPHGH